MTNEEMNKHVRHNLIDLLEKMREIAGDLISIQDFESTINMGQAMSLIVKIKERCYVDAEVNL